MPRSKSPGRGNMAPNVARGRVPLESTTGELGLRTLRLDHPGGSDTTPMRRRRGRGETRQGCLLAVGMEGGHQSRSAGGLQKLHGCTPPGSNAALQTPSETNVGFSKTINLGASFEPPCLCRPVATRRGRKWMHPASITLPSTGSCQAWWQSSHCTKSNQTNRFLPSQAGKSIRRGREESLAGHWVGERLNGKRR